MDKLVLKNLKNRIYYENHKEDITKTIICECKGRYNRTVKARHLKTKKHLKGLKIKQELDFYKKIRDRINTTKVDKIINQTCS